MDSQNKNLPANLDYSSVNEVYRSLRDHYDGQLTQEELLNGLKSGLAGAAGDPYTQYLDPKEAKKFNEQINGSFSGVGAELGQDANKNLTVVAPISGSPADKAGVMAGDIITAVDDKSTTGMSIDDAVSRIRGPKGTQVTLKVIRDKTEPLSFTITRDDIKIPSVETKTLDGNIGYIQISQFNSDTAALVRQAAQNFKDDGVKGIVLDLRDDPGGLLDAAVDVSSLWLPEGMTVLEEKRDNKTIKTYLATGGDTLKGIPTVVLINGGSASASEIVAGALKDNNAATLIGEKSYGKGSVQQLQNFKDGGELKVTIARWFRPNGENIDKKGIEPDKKIEISKEDAANKNDVQLNAAVEALQQ